jgi:hypothetical protein
MRTQKQPGIQSSSSSSASFSFVREQSLLKKKVLPGTNIANLAKCGYFDQLSNANSYNDIKIHFIAVVCLICLSTFTKTLKVDAVEFY